MARKTPGSPRGAAVGLRWIPAVLIAVLITIGSSMSPDTLAQSPIGIPDKLAHGIEYAALGAALAFALSPQRGLISIRHVMLAVILAVLFGITDEIHQAFVPGRDPSLADLGADAAGAVIGASAFRLVSVWNWRS